MDVAAIAASLVAATAARVQLAVAASLIRANVQGERSVVELIDAAQENANRLGALAPGVGGNLDVTA